MGHRARRGVAGLTSHPGQTMLAMEEGHREILQLLSILNV